MRMAFIQDTCGASVDFLLHVDYLVKLEKQKHAEWTLQFQLMTLNFCFKKNTQNTLHIFLVLKG